MSGAISEHLVETYTKGYISGDHTWRELGATDKALNITELCADLPHDKILEVGSGDGAILKKLINQRFGKEWHGLEISPTALSYMNKHVPEVQGTLYDGVVTPFANRSFDLVILSHVLEHLEHPRQVLFELARVGRHLFIEVPLEDTLRLSQNYVFDELGHINYYTPATVRRLVQTSGLTIDSGFITHSSQAVYQYRLGKLKGGLAYAIKQAALAAPRIAGLVWTYHYALVCHG
jgi:SAM-dependent methyltransferase